MTSKNKLGKKKLDKFEFMLLTLHLNVMDLPLETERLEHLLPLLKAVKDAHNDLIDQHEKEARLEELEQQLSWIKDYNDTVAYNLEIRIKELKKEKNPTTKKKGKK